MKEILVTKDGYQQFFDELEKLKAMISSNAVSGSEAYQNAVGDGWHDNFAYEEAMREHRSISAQIDQMLDEKKYLKIIEEKTVPSNQINIGDIFEVQMKYENGDIEVETLKLTGKYRPNINTDIKEISLNSPLGYNAYLKEVPSSFTYSVGDHKIEVEILKKHYK